MKNIPRSSGKFSNLSGKEYGSLLVLKRVENNRHGQVMYACRCKCRRVLEIEAGKLRSGNRTSCGCQKAERMRSINLIKISEEEQMPWNEGIPDHFKEEHSGFFNWHLSSEFAYTCLYIQKEFAEPEEIPFVMEKSDFTTERIKNVVDSNVEWTSFFNSRFSLNHSLSHLVVGSFSSEKSQDS